ncbi:hypothetical protein JI667_03590 [Bacillus sp. NTK074B]|nr:hypothetical protein [Bacillus sp. NTK074B]
MTSVTLDYEQGIVDIPAYLDNGIEFDAVIIYGASQKNLRRRKPPQTILQPMHKIHARTSAIQHKGTKPLHTRSINEGRTSILANKS